MDFRWQFVVLSNEDTRMDLRSVLYESSRTALLLDDPVSTDYTIPGSVYVSGISPQNEIEFKRIVFQKQ